jgi:hypothetical protein
MQLSVASTPLLRSRVYVNKLRPSRERREREKAQQLRPSRERREREKAQHKMKTPLFVLSQLLASQWAVSGQDGNRPNQSTTNNNNTANSSQPPCAHLHRCTHSSHKSQIIISQLLLLLPNLHTLFVIIKSNRTRTSSEITPGAKKH